MRSYLVVDLRITGSTTPPLTILGGVREKVARTRRHEVSMSVDGADDQEKKGRNEEEDIRSGAHARADAGR